MVDKGKEAYQFLSTLPARGATLDGRRRPVGLLEISIHAPREGSDTPIVNAARPNSPFLSTLPARGATSIAVTALTDPEFLSTLPARGATPSSWRLPIGQAEFLSTLPARGATQTARTR